MESMISKKDKIWLSLMEMGRKLGCHQMESRSFSYKGYQFPLCARCTGVFIGQVTALIQIIFGFRLSYKVIIFFIGSMGIDWLVQYMNIRQSNNVRRVITGTLCGNGMTFLYFYGLKSLLSLYSNKKTKEVGP